MSARGRRELPLYLEPPKDGRGRGARDTSAEPKETGGRRRRGGRRRGGGGGGGGGSGRGRGTASEQKTGRAEQRRTMPVVLLQRPEKSSDPFQTTAADESSRAPLYARGAAMAPASAIEEPPLDFIEVPSDYGLGIASLQGSAETAQRRGDRNRRKPRNRKKKDQAGRRALSGADGGSNRDIGYPGVYQNYIETAFDEAFDDMAHTNMPAMGAVPETPSPLAPVFEPKATAPAFIPCAAPDLVQPQIAVDGPVSVRRATAEDVDAVADFVYKAFRQAADEANVYSDTARTPERTRQIVVDAINDDEVHPMVAVMGTDAADNDEVCVGFNCLQTANNPLFGLGPLGVSPIYQSRSIGRELMISAVTYADEVVASVVANADIEGTIDVRNGTDPVEDSISPTSTNGEISVDISKSKPRQATVRLTVDAYNSRAFALYVKCGFSVTETLTVLHLAPGNGQGNLSPVPDGCEVEVMNTMDLEPCEALSTRFAGCSRRRELSAALQRPPGSDSRAYVLRGENGNLEAYTTGFSFWGHTVASSVEAATALFCGVQQKESEADLRILMPFRTQSQLGNWCLQNQWKVVKQLLLMTRGPELLPSTQGVFIPTADG